MPRPPHKLVANAPPPTFPSRSNIRTLKSASRSDSITKANRVCTRSQHFAPGWVKSAGPVRAAYKVGPSAVADPRPAPRGLPEEPVCTALRQARWSAGTGEGLAFLMRAYVRRSNRALIGAGVSGILMIAVAIVDATDLNVSYIVYATGQTGTVSASAGAGVILAGISGALLVAGAFLSRRV